MTETLNNRAIGIELFNQTWALMDKPDRSVEENDAMLHMAHASAHHWRAEGSGATPNNLARSEWQVSRVYSVLGRGEPALYHARRCVEINEANDAREDWELGSAYEAMARASAVAGDLAGRDEWKSRAVAELAKIADAEDRQVLEQDLATLP